MTDYDTDFEFILIGYTTARFCSERMSTDADRPTRREDFAFATSSLNMLAIITEIQRVWPPGVRCSS